MPKPMYVWSGSAWVSVASEVESLANFATQSYADNTPGTKLIVPSSVTIGSGSASVSTQGAITFTGVSSLVPNGFLSSSFDTYRVVLNLYGSSGGAELRFRFRNSSGEITTNYYGAGFITNFNNTSQIINPKSAGAEAVLNDITTPSGHSAITTFDLGNYASGASHQIQGQSISTYGGSARYFGYYEVSSGTALTSFTLYPSAGTITGTMRIYGYKNG